MSTATEITRLTDARNTIRDKMVDLGLATSTSKLDALATAVDGIVNRGSVSATVQEGDTYTIPAGYHNGSGTVSGVAGGGNYNLQSKTVTPTKNTINVTPDSGYYGISDVTVNPIPEAYQNVSSVTAAAGDVLSGKVIVDSTGASVAGTMPNNGAVSKTLDATSNNQSYTVPAGYHNGSGTVGITLETKTATPSTSSQNITPTAGKVLSKVTVNAIPSIYGNVSEDNAVAADVLYGKKAHTKVNSAATPITGTMPNNGAVSKRLDATANNQSYTVPVGYHNGHGTVGITLETKTATPSTSSQNITPTAGKVLSSVTVNAIPSQYKDTTNADAVAADILSGKVAVTGAGEVTGTMTNNGQTNCNLNGVTPVARPGNTYWDRTYTIPAGYHDGTGVVSIQTAKAVITPSTSQQTIYAVTTGQDEVAPYERVVVNAIPNNFGDTTGDDAVAANLLAGKVAHTDVNGVATQITGTMVNNGAISGSIDGLTTTSYSVPAGYTSGGTVSLTSDIETALAAI